LENINRRSVTNMIIRTSRARLQAHYFSRTEITALSEAILQFRKQKQDQSFATLCSYGAAGLLRAHLQPHTRTWMNLPRVCSGPGLPSWKMENVQNKPSTCLFLH
jgi:hypothetical protein